MNFHLTLNASIMAVNFESSLYTSFLNFALLVECKLSVNLSSYQSVGWRLNIEVSWKLHNDFGWKLQEIFDLRAKSRTSFIQFLFYFSFHIWFESCRLQNFVLVMVLVFDLESISQKFLANACTVNISSRWFMWIKSNII